MQRISEGAITEMTQLLVSAYRISSALNAGRRRSRRCLDLNLAIGICPKDSAHHEF